MYRWGNGPQCQTFQISLRILLLSYFAFCPFWPRLQIVLVTSPPRSQPRVNGRKQEAEGATRRGGEKSPQRLPVCLLRKFAILESHPPLIYRRLSEPTAHPCRLLLQPANPRYFHAIFQINNAERLHVSEESWPQYSGWRAQRQTYHSRTLWCKQLKQFSRFQSQRSSFPLNPPSWKAWNACQAWVRSPNTAVDKSQIYISAAAHLKDTLQHSLVCSGWNVESNCAFWVNSKNARNWKTNR